VIPLGVYGIGMSLAAPGMTVITLELFPRVRGLAASLQGFVFMIVFAIGSGVICPLVFDSAFHLSLGLLGGMALSAICWWLGTREASLERPSEVAFSMRTSRE
jgi:DHA1 family bicyclomycin/chloramphenicol resistance-like MFS transporter